MWPFTRKSQPEPSNGPAPVAAPVIRNDWKRMPPVQRAIGEHPLTAPSDVFANDLATHQDPSVVSSTLAHQVSIEAPAGLVLALARPSTRADGPAMISRPRLQRRSSTSAMDIDTRAPEPATDEGVASFRELPIVAGPPAIQRLTSLAPDAKPVPIGPGREIESRPREVQRSIAPASDEDPGMTAAAAMSDESPAALAPRRTLGQSRRLGLGAPLAQVPATSLQRAAELTLAPTQHHEPPADTARKSIDEPQQAAARPEAQPGSITGPSVTASLTGASALHETAAGAADAQPGIELQRLDLPLAPAGLPGSENSRDLQSPSETMPAESDVPPAPPVGELTGLQRSIESADNLSGLSGLSGLPSASGVLAARDLERPLLQRRASGNNATASESWGPRTAATGATPATLEPTRSAAIEPALAVQPMRYVAPRGPVISRLAVDGASNPAASTASFAPLAGARLLGTVVQRVPEVVSSRGKQSIDNPISGMKDEPSSFASFASFPSPMSDAVPGNDSLVSQGRTAGGQGLPLQRIATQPRSASDQAHDTALSLPLAPAASTASLQRAAAGIQAAAMLSIQRAGDEPQIENRHESFFQTQVQTASASASGPSSAPAPAAAAGAPATGAAPPDEAMEALAGKLYDRIRSRLKSELLVDRERAGLLTDLR